MITFQEMLSRLSKYWEAKGCIIHQGYDAEVGAGTFNPATFLRCLGKEPYRAAYIEPCRRPTDGRYGENPNRLQHYFQYQVIMKPSPLNIQEMYLDSLKAIGFDLSAHDIRFVHDDWENPTIGAFGLGWEVWMDGMEVTQFTYFQSVGGLSLKPVTVEITYGIERLAMYLQNVKSIFDLKWDSRLTYGDIYHRNEVEWSTYNFEKASTKMWLSHFNDYEQEALSMIREKLPIPAYDFVMKASHSFNLLDARGAISVTERTGYITRIRDLAKQVAESYLESREALQFPLLKRFEEEPLFAPKQTETLDAFKNCKPEETEDFLLEIGSEELPATFVPIGLRNLKNTASALLKEHGIPFRTIKTYGTPRRLSLYIEGVTLAKKEVEEEKRGPSIAQGFDAKGAPTKAVEGFLAAYNIKSPSLDAIKSGKESALTIRKVKDADYLFVKTKVPGFTTASLLAEKLPGIVLNLEFPKKMRWGNLEITYARPLHWILALLGNHVVPFTVGNIASGRISYGHRQRKPYDFSVVKAEDYLSLLKEYRVMVDPEERSAEILKQLEALESEMGGTVIAKEEILPLVVNMCEWPKVVYADFDSKFLSAPKEVLISEMVKHQFYFPVADSSGNLKNLFVITADTKPSEEIKRGNQKVLSARLSDGVFLYNQGLKNSLSHYNEKLKSVTFQKELGSLFDKVERTMKHIALLQKRLQISTEKKALRSAELSKFDLATEMVYEFPDLQGTIGKYYALAKNEDSEVAESLEEQWMPRGEKGPLPKTATGVLLSLSEKIDNLLGCYLAGLKPTSSSDPYSLRRQTLGIIKIIIDQKLRLNLKDLLSETVLHFPEKVRRGKEDILPEVEAFIQNRVKTVFLDYGFDKDEIESALSSGFSDIYDAYSRVDALHKFRKANVHFQKLYEVYKRAKGQINGYPALSFSPSLLKESAEKELDQQLKSTEVELKKAIDAHDYDRAYGLIAKVQPHLAALFEQVKILADDESLRQNRIALLQRVFTLFEALLDFSKING